MAVCLIYGTDATGKSSQLKAICDAAEDPILISLELKNRRLYRLDHNGKMTDDTPFEVVEPLVLERPPSFATVPVETFHSMGRTVERILNNQGADGKQRKYKTVVIDGISDFKRWAEHVVIAELRKKWPDTTAIGKENLAAWESRNRITALPLERLSAWSEINGTNVFFSTLMEPEYLNGNKSGYRIGVQDHIRDKVCDTRVGLFKDGRGFIARFEKIPPHVEWDHPLPYEMVVKRGMLGIEMMKMGLI